MQTLVFGWWHHPDASLAHLAQVATVVGEPISPQGLDQRFGEAGAELLHACLEAAAGQVITADPVAAGVLARFPAVCVLDSTTVSLPDALAPTWPGCGGRVPQGSQAALKLTVRQDLVRGGLEGPVLSAGRVQDKHSPLQTAPLPGGALRLADQGYWSLAVLHQIAAGASYFLSRLHCQTTVFVAGAAVDLVPWLRRQRQAQIDVAVTLGKTVQLPARLLAQRLPKGIADRQLAKLRKDAQREGETVSARRLALAGWVLLVTNLPSARLSLPEAVVLGRVRWQIELLFKLWKHDGGLATSRSVNSWRVLCEVYAKLIALICQHWLLLVGCWESTDRSLVRAAAIIRDWVPLLALEVSHPARMVATVQLIERFLATSVKIAKRRKHPSAFQLLAEPERGYA